MICMETLPAEVYDSARKLAQSRCILEALMLEYKVKGKRGANASVYFLSNSCWEEPVGLSADL